MKNLMLSLFVALGITSCNNQQNPIHGETGHQCNEECKPMAESQKNENGIMDENFEKQHECTGSCSNGQHQYTHGEIGHVCSNECISMIKESNIEATSETEKIHQCTSSCTNMQHQYEHGENGHKCDEKCAKM